MPLSKSQIRQALADGKRVLCREIVSEEEWLVACFEDDWSYLIRTKQVPPKRGVLYEKVLALFKQRVAEKAIRDGDVRHWLRSTLTVEIEDSADASK